MIAWARRHALLQHGASSSSSPANALLNYCYALAEVAGVVYVVGGGPTGGGSFTYVNEAFAF